MGYTYLASDLHGCYDKYKKLLEAINLREEDKLYILGDAVDRGDKPVSIIKDLMTRENVELIMGNHEVFALKVLLDDNVEAPIDEISEEFYDEVTKQHYYTWLYNGGVSTFEEFIPLPKEERKEILDFLKNLPVYIEIGVNGNKYFLVHAGIENYTNDDELAFASPDKFIWYSPTNYENKPFPGEENRYLVFGHTPTFRLPGAEPHKIFIKNNYIALDCGCVYDKNNGKIGCLRLEDMKEFYV